MRALPAGMNSYWLSIHRWRHLTLRYQGFQEAVTHQMDIGQENLKTVYSHGYPILRTPQIGLEATGIIQTVDCFLTISVSFLVLLVFFVHHMRKVTM